MSSQPEPQAWSAWAPFDVDEPVLPDELRVNDGPSPVFGDLPLWDLTAMGLAPNLNAAQAHLRFDVYPSQWVAVAKTLAMAMLQPVHVVVRDAGVYRSNRPYKLKSIRHTLTELRYLADWAATVELGADLSNWTPADCDAYLNARKARSHSAGRNANDLLRHLNGFGGLLPNGGLSVRVAPWVTEAGGQVKTPAIPPSTFWPLVRACWSYIDIFAPDIIAARDEFVGLDARAPKDRAVGSSPTDVDAALDNWLSSANAFVPLHTYTLGRARKGEINWDGLALCTTPHLSSTNFYNKRGRERQSRVHQAIRDGVPTRFGYSSIEPAIVDRPDGTRGSWTIGFDRTTARAEVTQLRNAAYIFVAIMTMMRDSEVQSLGHGATCTYYGAPAVTSTLHKMQTHGGTPRRWWVSEPVIRALQIAEQIAQDDDRLFGTVRKGQNRDLVGFDQYEQIRSFVAWVNDHSPRNGLNRIPTTNLAPHMFRRTMAVITANEPDGEIALGITLKHNAIRALANATTSGYGLPTPDWSKEFETHKKDAAAAELVADWARHAQGKRFARGPGAATFIDNLDEVTDRASTPAAKGDERMLRNLLRDEFATIRLGTLNHCLGDPTKARCLEGMSAAARESGPIPSMCSPATCRNSVITDSHVPIWQQEEADLVTKLKDRRMATIHRERLEAQLADVRRITQQEPK
ncbi:hypothetical protein ACWDTI_02735 [Gordonia sp. NPDC003424]